MENKKQLGQIFQDARKNLKPKETQAKVAKKAGVSLDWYRKIEQGRAPGTIGFETVAQITKATGSWEAVADFLEANDSSEVINPEINCRLDPRQLGALIRIACITGEEVTDILNRFINEGLQKYSQ